MRLLLVNIFLCLFFLFALTSAEAAEPFAVVELFASEGCSSCPPADELLSAVTEMARRKGFRIFTLSFQVDYWNKLGWVDPYSKAQFTERQRDYAKVLQAESVYTPQMIVNGIYAFVGSESEESRNAVGVALNTPATNGIVLKIKKSDAGALEVVYNCEQLTDNAVLNFALIERGLESHVTAGENAGTVLKHDNVVREFKTIAFKQKEGTVSFARPVGNDLSRFSITAYVQEEQTMKIIAAENIDLK